MKIALVNENGSPLASAGGDGPKGWQRALAQSLARQGHQVTLYARNDGRDLPGRAVLGPGVAIEHLRAGPARRLPALTLAQHAGEFGERLAARWRREAPDIAHAQHWTSGLAALAGCRGLGIPLVQTFSSPAVAEPRRGQPGPETAAEIRMEAAIARSVAGIAATCAPHVPALARLGVPRTAIRVLPRGVDTARFTPDGPAAPRSGRPRLLALGPLTERQGLHTLLMALADVPAAELILAGGPPPAQLRRDKACQAAARLARKLRVRDRVTFTGAVPEGDLPALLRSADLLVSAAWYEPAGTAALKAMACGVPVLATDVGALSDAVIHDTTGILLPPGQPSLFASRIRHLLANPSRRQAYAIAAVDRARSRYSWDRIADQATATYQQILQAPLPAPTS